MDDLTLVLISYEIPNDLLSIATLSKNLCGTIQCHHPTKFQIPHIGISLWKNDKPIYPSTINSHILWMLIFWHYKHVIYWAQTHLSNIWCTSFVNYISCHYTHVQRNPYIICLENYAKLPSGSISIPYNIYPIIW